jgi:hypothetical protein
MSKRAPTPAELTTTTGYFNGNKYPLTINSNALALNITLQPGGYICERGPDGKMDGQRINDPRLDGFLQPGGLTKQLGDPTALVLLNTTGGKGIGVSAAPWKPQPMPQQRAINPVQQVQRAPTNVLVSDRKQPGGIMPPKPHAPSDKGSAGFTGGPMAKKPELPGFTPTGINPAVRAFPGREGVAEAEARNVIRRARPPIEGPDAEDGLSAKNAPYVDEIVTPGALRRQQEAAPKPPAGGPRVTITTPVGAPPKEPAPVVLTDATVKIPESDVYEGADLPDPTVPDAPAPAALPEAQKKFVCAADGKSYTRFDNLKKYVLKTYPDRADELLAPYKTR